MDNIITEIIGSKLKLHMGIACAGAGKTTLIKKLCEKCIKDNPEWNLLITSFTRGTIDVANERLNSEKVKIATFHALSLSYIQGLAGTAIPLEHIKFLGYKDDYRTPFNISVCDVERRKGLLKQIIELRGLRDSENEKDGLVESAANHLDRSFRNGINTETNVANAEIRQIIDDYVSIKTKGNLIDFNDMIGLFRAALMANTKLRENVSNAYDLIIVDEGQDCTRVQFDIIKLLKEGSNKIVIVGDPCQLSYRFLGASCDFFSMIEDAFGKDNVAKYKLAISYRCPASVSKLSNAITGQIGFSNKTEMTSTSGREDFKPVLVEHTWEEEGIKYFVKEIKALLKDGNRCVVLFRTFSGILSENKSLLKMLKNLLTKNKIEYCCKNDIEDKSDKKVTISTIHSFKGDEAEFVFVVDVSNGNIPFKHIAAMPSKDHTDEELCLLNVAVTRTIKRLYMCYQRSVTGRDTLSPYLRSIVESGLVDVIRLNKCKV